MESILQSAPKGVLRTIGKSAIIATSILNAAQTKTPSRNGRGLLASFFSTKNYLIGCSGLIYFIHQTLTVLSLLPMLVTCALKLSVLYTASFVG